MHVRRLSHQPKVVLCVLVKILGFDDVTCLGSSTGHCQVSHVARLGVNALIGPLPGGPRCEPVRAGREWPGVVSLTNAHVSCGGFGMADLLREGGRQFARHDRGCGSVCSFRNCLQFLSNRLASMRDHLSPSCRVARPSHGFRARRQRVPTVQRKSDRASRGKPGRSRLGLRARVQFYRSHAAQRMGHTRRRSLRASEYTQSRQRFDNQRAHALNWATKPRSSFWSCGGSDCDRVTLALERSSDGKLGSRKPTQ